VLSDVGGFAFVTRGKDYTVLDHPLVQARLHLPPDQSQQRPESQMVRSLYDCPEVPVGPEGVLCRVVVATHPEGSKKSPVGVTHSGVVYELFFTALPQQAFTASDVVELYLHRGAFEPALSDEDNEQDPDRWCSHAAWGQECWQVVSQWVWNEAPGARASAGTDAPTHDRVCPCPPAAERAACHASGLISTHVRVWFTHDGHLLEDGSLLGARLSSPARWDPPLSSGPGASCPGAASRSRWQSAHGVCSQHPQLPSLPIARTVSKAGQRYGEAATGECPPASARGWE